MWFRRNWFANERFRTAELTAAVLCVSAPELGSLFHTRKRGQASASILNGTYRRDMGFRMRTSSGVPIVNPSYRTMDSECYLELHEGNKCDVEASQESALGAQCMPGEFNITQEIRVVSSVV